MLEEQGLLAHPHTSAGPRADRRRATATSSTALLPARAPAPQPARARADARAPRGRRGDARDDRDALAGHEPAGDRLRAADRHDDDPPRRGPAAAAAGADGRRSSPPPAASPSACSPSTARSTPGSPTGRPPTSTSSSSGMGLGARMLRSRLDRPDAARRPSARSSPSSRPRSPSSPRRRRTRCTSTARARLLSRVPLPGRLAAQRADGDARAPRVAARRALRRRSTERDLYVRIGARERRAGAAVAVARRRQLRAAAAQPRHGLGDRADADGLRARRSAPCARPRVQLSRFVEDVYDEA